MADKSKSTTSLESIGFYTLSDARAAQASETSPLWRCELLVTGGCNFRCPYCRHIGQTLTLEEAKRIVDMWCADGLKNVRFSGGEPTLWPHLTELVAYAAANGVERIAISTNGSADLALYEDLVRAGVGDISVSLDACCGSTGDMMAGGIPGAWDTVVANIEALSAMTYVTVGIVATEDNLEELRETILFADRLGVADIRVIPAAQWDCDVASRIDLPGRVLAKHPILRYRSAEGHRVRGIGEGDSRRCGLAVDDMAVMGSDHYPCIIYMREQGAPIGSLAGQAAEQVRQDRSEWSREHDTHRDPICRANCLDVCVQYNNAFRESNPA